MTRVPRYITFHFQIDRDRELKCAIQPEQPLTGTTGCKILASFRIVKFLTSVPIDTTEA